MQNIYALVSRSVCVCVQSPVSILDSHATLPVLEAVNPPLPYPLLSIWLACWLVLYGTSRMVCASVCVRVF